MSPGALRAWLSCELEQLDRQLREPRRGNGQDAPWSRPSDLEIAGMKQAYARVMRALSTPSLALGSW